MGKVGGEDAVSILLISPHPPIQAKNILDERDGGGNWKVSHQDTKQSSACNDYCIWDELAFQIYDVQRMEQPVIPSRSPESSSMRPRIARFDVSLIFAPALLTTSCNARNIAFLTPVSGVFEPVTSSECVCVSRAIRRRKGSAYQQPVGQSLGLM